jgi:RNA polymerase sigma-70 factor (ECF subfamily)
MAIDERSDEELARWARTEPRQAFDLLFERHRGPLYNFLLRQGAAESRAEDLFQTVFLKAWRALPSFREEARFKTWLCAIAVNVLQDERRSAARRSPPAALTEAMTVAAEAPADRGETLDRLRAALDGLPARHRALFTLARFQGLSIAEAAAAVGMSPAAAKVTLFRIQKKVGERVAPMKERRT